MMEAKDWVSGLLGFAVFILGAVPILESLNLLNWGFTNLFSSDPFTAAIPYILAILGFYLAIESVIELTNSNHIGWMSFFVGVIIMIVGLLPTLKTFGIGPGLFGFELPTIVYNIIFVIEGFFLMIAMFAMEL